MSICRNERLNSTGVEYYAITMITKYSMIQCKRSFRLEAVGVVFTSWKLG